MRRFPRLSPRSLLVASAGLLAGSAAWAQNVDQLQTLGQDEFRLLSEDLGAVLSYRPQTPTTPLGITGFDVGVAATASKVKHVDVLDKATADNNGSTVYVPTLRAHKGLPFGIDVGVQYAKVPSSNIKHYGGEVRYAILEGTAVTPAVGIRGSMTKISGVDQLDLDTKGVDVSISKGFVGITPYAGFGRVWTTSTPKGTAVSVAGLSEEKFSQTKAFVGVGFNFALLNLNLEADKTGDVNSYSAKVGLRF
jgi:hypothetical protein